MYRHLSVTVNAKDAVGNSAAPATITNVKVTRVRWMRNMTGKVDTFKAVRGTSTPTNQIILGGTEHDNARQRPSFHLRTGTCVG